MSRLSLAGKKLLIVGGNGYVGSAIARQAISLGANVYSVSKSGEPKNKQPWTSKVEWIQGDARHPVTFKNYLEESDAVIHTVGTLIDSSITKFRNPGDNGTYEVLNRDTAKALGAALDEIGGKKLVYLSASQGAQFISRYLETKRQAEEFLFTLPHVKVTVLRPGFIYSSRDRPWTMPLKVGKDLFSGVRDAIEKFSGENPAVKEILQKVKLDHSIDVNAVAISAVLAAFKDGYNGQIVESKEMKRIWEDFQKNIVDEEKPRNVN